MVDKTFRRYVEIAGAMRSIGSNSLDISNLNENESYIITCLVKYDKIFEFFDACKDIRIEKMIAAIKLLDAEDAYRKAKIIY